MAPSTSDSALVAPPSPPLAPISLVNLQSRERHLLKSLTDELAAVNLSANKRGVALFSKLVKACGPCAWGQAGVGKNGEVLSPDIIVMNDVVVKGPAYDKNDVVLLVRGPHAFSIEKTGALNVMEEEKVTRVKRVVEATVE